MGVNCQQKTAEAREEERISFVALRPSLSVQLVGIATRRACFAMWVVLSSIVRRLSGDKFVSFMNGRANSLFIVWSGSARISGCIRAKGRASSSRDSVRSSRSRSE
jgi:hypothetical protein